MTTSCSGHCSTLPFARLCLALVLVGCAGAPALAEPVPAQPKLVQSTKGRVTIGIPATWKEATIPGATDLVGLWSTDGKGVFDSTAFILIAKTDNSEVKLGPEQLLSETQLTVGGLPARRLEFRSKPGETTGFPGGGRAVGLLVDKAGPDGKYLSFIFAGRADQWNTIGPLFDRVIASVTIDGVGAEVGVRGVVKVSDRGVRSPGEGVTILVGNGLRLEHPTVPDPTDRVLGTRIVGQAKTNKDGTFFVAVPSGNYRLIAWKEGCVPHEFDALTVPPGIYNVALTRDNQPGAAGRHQKLDVSGVKPLPPGGGLGIPAPLLPLIFGAAPQELIPRTVGNVTVSVPADWSTDPDTPADEGAWLTGKFDKPDAYVAVMRDTSFDGLAALIAPTGTPVTIGGRTATSYTGSLKNETGVTARLVVLNTAEKDGRRLALFAKAPEALWKGYAATFDAIFASAKLSEGPKPVAPPPVEEGLKELAKVARIPGFESLFSYTAYEDRVVLTDATGKTSTLGVAGRGKTVAACFRAFVEKEKATAALLGEPVSLELNVAAGAATVQLFEGGALVLEKASGTVWYNTHAKRPRNLRPADEITRYPYVIINKVQYAISVSAARVVVEDVAAKKSMGVSVGPAGEAIPELFRKVIEKEKLASALGAAVSDYESVFDTSARVQVYEGGVVIALPDGRYWWCRHPKRGSVSVPPVLALPKDPNAIVIQLDYVGGYTPPRKSNDPYLRVRADGRVTLIDPFGTKKTVEAKLAPENVLAFVKFAVENDFFALDSAALERAIRDEAARLKLPTILDLPTTVVTIRTADKVHEVRCYAPEFYAEQLPKLKSVQQFQAVHQRLAAYLEKLREP